MREASAQSEALWLAAARGGTTTGGGGTVIGGLCQNNVAQGSEDHYWESKDFATYTLQNGAT